MSYCCSISDLLIAGFLYTDGFHLQAVPAQLVKSLRPAKATYLRIENSSTDENAPPKNTFSSEARELNKIAKWVPAVGTGGR